MSAATRVLFDKYLGDPDRTDKLLQEVRAGLPTIPSDEDVWGAFVLLKHKPDVEQLRGLSCEITAIRLKRRRRMADEQVHRRQEKLKFEATHISARYRHSAHGTRP